MRDESRSPYEICVYCKQPIEPHTIFKRLTSGDAAHLKCYTDHLDDEPNEPPS